MKQIEVKFGYLRLRGMGRTYQALSETKRLHELSFNDGLEVLLQGEQDERSNNKRERLLKQAKFRYQASLEELIYKPSRELDRGLITSLATGEYIAKGESILVSGCAGVGKSFLISALGANACSHGYSVAYYNTQKLLMETKMARLDGNIMKFFQKLAKTSLLIIDDFGLSTFDQQSQFDFMEIMEDRHGKMSTIMASQLPVENWIEVFTESTVAEAVLDRIVHNSYRFTLKGDSLRKIR